MLSTMLPVLVQNWRSNSLFDEENSQCELNENMCNASVHRSHFYGDHVAETWFMSDCFLRFKGESADADDADLSIRTVR